MWAGRRRGIRVRRDRHGPAAPWRSPRPALLHTSHPPIIVLLICDVSITSTGKCYLGITNMNGSRDLARTGQCGGPPCAHLSLDSTHARDCIGFHNERQLTTTQCAEATASAHWVVVSCRSLWKPMQSRACVESRDKWAQGGPPH